MGTLGLMRELDRTGDTPIQWDPADKDQVEAAKAKFKELRAKGYRTFTLNKESKQGEQLDEFDPNVERILASPPFIGG